MDWPTGERPFVPNASAVIVYVAQAGTKEITVTERVRITPKQITTGRGDRYNPETGRWIPRSGGRDFMKRGRWLVSVTPDGDALRTFAESRGELAPKGDQ
jgi:hypothetical protein